MKFLIKKNDSVLLQEGLTYKEKGDNSRLRELLFQEQKGFCAYSEKRMGLLDSKDVEHFDSRLKNKPEDSYWNWYLCLHYLNIKKRDEFFQENHPEIFTDRFFQDKSGLADRIIFSNGIFAPKNPDDLVASRLIEFLMCNEYSVAQERRKWVKRVKKSVSDHVNSGGSSSDYFREFPDDVSFVTALEAELNIDLSEFYS